MKNFTGKKWLLIPLILLIIFTTLAAGCGGAKETTSATQPATYTASRPHPVTRTGEIKTGTKVDAVTQTVTTTGGMVAIAKTGDPLDGLVINVPAGAYTGTNTFKVSYAPITSQTFGADITPISPMITVDNGGNFSSSMMYIRVPVKVPADSFAMGFYYDPATKQLAGMPLLSTGTDSITVGADHFSNFFISIIAKSLLKKDIDSGFRPGIDDWEFVNWGSYIAQGGQCEGQSLSALWYYSTQPDGKDLCLYGRYDNNGNQPATPALWQDDSLGYRFASVIQTDISSLDFANKFWLNMGGIDWVLENNKWKMVQVDGISNESTWCLFAYSIYATHEPQLVIIWSKDGGGHAMICYEIKDGNLYIADPNYPGNTERRIEYTNGKFKPYNSGANAAEIKKGNGHAYENIQYYAKSTVVSWSKIAQRWTEFKNKTIGSDKFPAYTIQYKDEKGVYKELKDGFVSTNKLIDINADSQVGGGINVYRDGVELTWDANGNYTLLPGNNQLGVYFSKSINNDLSYIDFKYINVVYNANATTEAGMLAKLQKCSVFSFNIAVDGPYTVNGPEFKNGTTTYAGSVQTPFRATGVKWNGTSFSANAMSDAGTTGTLSGTMSADGMTLLTLTANITQTGTNSSSKWSYTVNNFPIVKWGTNYGTSFFYDISSAGLNSYVTAFQWNNASGKDTSTMQPDWTSKNSMVIIMFDP